MPLVRIETQEGRSTEVRKALLDAVHDALVETFRIPDTDRQQRLVEYPAESFEAPAGKSSSYVLVTIDALPGRSTTAKKDLYAALVRKFERLGMDPEDVLVVINEIPVENWGIRDG